MAVRTRSNFKSTKNSRITTNGTGDITGSSMNDMFEDAADSHLFLEDFGDNLIKYVKITVSSAEILALNTTPKTLVAAQGSGTIIQPLFVQIFYDYNSAAYATNTNLQFFINTAEVVAVGGVINQTQDIYYNVAFGSAGLSTANQSNQPLTLKVETGDPTAGNSPLYLYLSYRIITL